MRIRTLLLLLISSLPAIAAAQTLERGNGPEPSTLDAHRCPEVACGNVLRDLYEGLVAEDARGRIIPGMAERWEVSADGRRWTFHLRANLRWSNGEALTAEQIVRSFRRAFAPATAAPLAGHFEAVVGAREVQQGAWPPQRLGIHAPDARTLVIELTRAAPLPALLTLPLAMPVYLPAIERHGAQHTRPGHLVGNGAYTLQAWRPQANLTLQRNPHFHTPAAIAQVRFHVTEDAASELQRFAAGGLHLTETVPPQPLANLRQRFGAQLRISPYLGSFFFGFNLQQAPFRDNPALREALSLALDRDILTRHVTGLGELPSFSLVPPGISDYPAAAVAAARWTQAQRERRARALYQQAGYSARRPLQLELRYNTSTPHRRLALAAAAMWREVLGVQTRLRNEEWKVFVQNRGQRVVTQVFRGGWIADLDDPANFLANFRSDAATNWSGFVDAGFDALLAQADAAATPAQRNALLAQAETRLLAQHAILPIYSYSSKHLVHRDLLGFEANPLDRHPSRFLHWRKQAPRPAR